MRQTAGACIGVLTAAMLASPLAAQQSAAAPSEGEETIVVTGFRNVAKPIAQTKRESQAIVDTLTQVEIERLPDRSLAEVLDRVAGVSSDRGFSSSQPRTVTLRGFDARYNSMDVDGNLIWNSSRNNRGTQLDVFPASVINQIDVFKTVTPDMDANSIGGHLSLRTLRAFDGGTGSYLKARAAYGVYEQNGIPDGARPSFRVDAAGKFTFGPDRRFGVVLGGEHQRHEFYDVYNEVTAYSVLNGIDVLNGNIFGGLFQQRQDRTALYAKLETRSADQLYGFLSASYFDDRILQTFNRGGPFIAANRVTNARPGGGDFTQGTAEIYFEEYKLRRETLLLGSGVDFRIADRAAINLRGAYTRYNHDESTYRSERFQITNLTGSYALDTNFPSATLAPASATTVADAANWVHRTARAGFFQPIPHKDDVFNASADLNINAQPSARGFGVRAGVYWRRLDRDFNQTTVNYTLPAGRVYRLSQALDPRLGTQVIDANRPAFIDRAAYMSFIAANATIATNDALTTDYRLKEDVVAGHASVQFATDWLTVLAGFRIEKTSFDNATANTRSGTIVPETRRFDYTEFLPNIQAVVEPVQGVKLRAAFTETLARPDFADFANGITVSFNAAGAQIVSGANPFLAPRTARNYDASFEYYFNGGYLALGVFHKDLANETFRQVRNTTDANGIITLIETIPLNTGSARVTGLELSFVKERFDFLPGPLANFGINANYTYLDGTWNVSFTDGTRRTVKGLRNQPRWLANIILNYKQDRFAASLGYRLRGRTFTGSFGATAPDDLYIDPYDRLDGQISFRLLPQLTLFAEAKNLTNSFWTERSGVNTGALRLATSPGRSYWFGANFKM